jgi:predicted signal transduction protein with EAL and GGDEF domain
LKAVAERLRGCVRETDMVARLGGDEFAILESVGASSGEAAALAIRIQAAMGEPFELDGQHFIIGTSIGISVAPEDGTDPDQLLKNADLALYRAKKEGHGNHRFFEPEMNQRMQARRELECGLRNALVNGEFELHYQPFVNLAREEVCGFEALLRWNHPERRATSPAEFVPLAEETGLIVPIGEWVLREACKTAASWPEEITVAVNLSPIQFKNRNLIHHVTNAIADAGIAPSRLEIEVTESLLLSDGDVTIKVLHQLRKLGVRISMDDFGTGYSSLSHLRSFPFDKIKIDRSFVHDLTSKGDSLALVKAVIGLGRSLGIATTAEGVETEAQLDMVRQQGCSEVQGFLFSPPLPAAAVTRLFAASSPASLLSPARRSAS